jgi:predicted nucleic acid-binding protein
MILVDTTLWIDYFSARQPILGELIGERQAAIHDLIIGELAVGDLRDRPNTLYALSRIKQAQRVSDREALDLIEVERLWGLGLGFVDIHLLASTLVTPECLLWTRDKKLAAEAQRLGVGYSAASQ